MFMFTAYDIGAKIKSFHVDEDNLHVFYKQAAIGWREPTFLSENAMDVHILFFDLDILVYPEDPNATVPTWTSEHSTTTTKTLLSTVLHTLACVYITTCKCTYNFTIHIPAENDGP